MITVVIFKALSPRSMLLNYRVYLIMSTFSTVQRAFSARGSVAFRVIRILYGLRYSVIMTYVRSNVQNSALAAKRAIVDLMFFSLADMT